MANGSTFSTRKFRLEILDYPSRRFDYFGNFPIGRAKLSYHSLSDRNFWYFDADDKYELLVLTKLVRSIWLDIAFFFACLWTWTKSRSIQYAKKKKQFGQYPAILTEQAWSIKDLLYGIKHQHKTNFPCDKDRIKIG